MNLDPTPEEQAALDEERLRALEVLGRAVEAYRAALDDCATDACDLHRALERSDWRALTAMIADSGVLDRRLRDTADALALARDAAIRACLRATAPTPRQIIEAAAAARRAP